MELKKYQQNVIDDLEAFLRVLEDSISLKTAFADYWKMHARFPLAVDKIVPYHDKVIGVPRVCLKVPTAGGKTFIAVNALQPIFAAHELSARQARLVVWLVPSESILSQTLANLRDLAHPYRQKLTVHFGNHVNILDKEQVLRGTDFDADSVVRGISIIVMTFDSLKGRSKETLRAFRENPNLASFDVFRPSQNELTEFDDTALINVLRSMNPVIIVDESHNASTPLSEEMLLNLNPCFVLELTATPHENSNIISYVDAMALHSEQMIKLPLMVSQQNSQSDVMMAALTLRHNLEALALAEQTKGGAYIRPIILFQAEPKSKEDTTTFEKVKAQLLDIGIPENQIAIKTSEINELKNVDLLSPDCEVRFVITVNALKEGWDCPFAYILANLANKSSVVDVTQIVGRVLRQPYARWHNKKLLNSSFVFTSSEKFHETLKSLEMGLVNAGFSREDYRIAQTEMPPENTLDVAQPELTLTAHELPDIDDFNVSPTFKLPNNMSEQVADNPVAEQITELVIQTIAANVEFGEQAQAATAMNAPPTELQEKITMYPIRPEFTEMMADFRLPQFVIHLDNGLFNEAVLFDRTNLLIDFPLGRCDTVIDFGQINGVVYTSEFKNEREVEFSPLKNQEKQELLNLFANQSDETQQKSLVESLFQLAGKRAFYPIDDNDVRKYFRRIVEDMTDAQRKHCFEHIDQYYKVIKKKIDGLAGNYAEQEFFRQREKDALMMQAMYSFKTSIAPTELATSLGKSLYEREGKISDFETMILRKILEDNGVNLRWWHRNESKKGFCINSFINHFPDFVLLTEKGTVVALETKGEQLDGTGSKDRIRAGKDWEKAANALNDGRKYRYMMVFDQERLEGAYDVAAMLDLLRSL